MGAEVGAGGPTCPRLVSGDTSDRGDQIDAHRRRTELYDLIRVLKIVWSQAHGGEAEGLECGDDALGIGRMRLYEDIKVAGETWCAVKGERIPADNQALNAVGAEQREQLFEVWLRFHNIVRANSRR